MAVTKDQKREIFEKHGQGENDTGSTPAQIALFTKRIEDLSSHLKNHKKDYSTLRALQKLVGKRRKLLKYYKKKNIEKYRELTSELAIRR